MTVLIHGQYLVRSVTLTDSTLAITGDVSTDTEMETFAPKHARRVTWNGQEIKTHRTHYGSLQAHLAGPPRIDLPPLTGWKWKDSLPEREAGYDDSGDAWVGSLPALLHMHCIWI